MEGDRRIPALRVRHRAGQADVRDAVQERQDLRRLLPEQGHRRAPDVPDVRRQVGAGDHARGRDQPVPRGQRREAARLHQGRHGLGDGLHGFHLARQADGHQDPERPARARRLQEGRGIFLHPARPVQFRLRQLPRAEPGQSHPHRSAGARARHHERAADLPLGLERHGHDHPPPAHLQRARCAACRCRAATRTIATSNITCPTWRTACRSRGRARGRKETCTCAN